MTKPEVKEQQAKVEATLQAVKHDRKGRHLWTK
jgi:hypothetical protein